MSRPLRCLFAWELGENYGHIARCLPIALRLRALGCEILFAVRDSRGAAELLSAHRMAFVQAPRLQRVVRSARAPVNYSDMLLTEGYQGRLSLQGAVQSWLGLFSLFKPDLLIADHSPTALLSAHAVGLPAAMLGNGFEIPPNVSPLPSILPWESVAYERLKQADDALLDAMNGVLRGLQRNTLHSVSHLVESAQRILATFSELDHFGPRLNANYVGVFYSLDAGQKIDWPSGDGKRILVYLRPRVPGFAALLEVLRNSPHQVIFVSPGTHTTNIQRFNARNLRFLNAPVALEPLLSSADAAIGYGSAGFTAQVLRAGVPLLLLPKFAEQQLGATQVEAMGAGIMLGPQRNCEILATSLESLLADRQYTDSARHFADRYRSYDAEAEIDLIVLRLFSQPQKFNT